MPPLSRRTTRRALLGLLGASLLATPALAGETTGSLTEADETADIWASRTAGGSALAAASAAGLAAPEKKDIAMRLVSSAENSSLDWTAQYGYIEDIGDNRGYTGGIIGFCSGTNDMLKVVELYTERVPGNVLAEYLPALRAVNGTDSHEGLDPGFPAAWRAAAADPAFRKAQRDEVDRVYFDPAVERAKQDGLGTLGQFAYYDAMVMHGPGTDALSFDGIRERALARATPPAQGGNEKKYLAAFLDARVWAMKQEKAHHDVTRVETAQRVFLERGNLDLDLPLTWAVYGERYRLS